MVQNKGVTTPALGGTGEPRPRLVPGLKRDFSSSRERRSGLDGPATEIPPNAVHSRHPEISGSDRMEEASPTHRGRVARLGRQRVYQGFQHMFRRGPGHRGCQGCPGYQGLRSYRGQGFRGHQGFCDYRGYQDSKDRL